MAHARTLTVAVTALALICAGCASPAGRPNAHGDGANSPRAAALGYYRSEVQAKVGHRLRFFCAPTNSNKTAVDAVTVAAGPLAASVVRDGSRWIVALRQASNMAPVARYEVVRNDGAKYCVDRALNS